MNDLCLEATVKKIWDIKSGTSDEGQKWRNRNILLEDDSGTGQLSLWNEDVELGDLLEEGQTIRIEGGYTKPSDYCEDHYDAPAELRLGKKGELLLLGENGPTQLREP